VQAYHQARGSLRTWTPRTTIQAALASGGTVDIRPGDTCLIDHHGGNTPSHIVMVESYNPTTRQLVGTSSAPPAGGYSAASGATVWGVGRPSAVDFEEGHDYATSQVPAALQHTSPADICALAQRRGTEGAAAR
jgi:hypothetical protein